MNYLETGVGLGNKISPPRRAPRRIASLWLAQLRASLSAHPAVTSRTPRLEKGLEDFYLQIMRNDEQKEKPARGFFLSIFPDGVRFLRRRSAGAEHDGARKMRFALIRGDSRLVFLLCQNEYRTRNRSTSHNYVSYFSFEIKTRNPYFKMSEVWS